MKLKALSLALLALPIASFAEEPVDNYPTLVNFTVESEKNVERDLFRVSLFYQAEGNDLSALNKTMAEKMNKAIELTKAQSAVEIKDNSRNTWIRYNDKGKQQGWTARAELTLESKDSQALSTLVHELDGVLAIDSVSASVSREKLSSLENELTKEALTKFKDKALLLQESLQMKGYTIQNLEISSPNDSTNDYPIYAAAELSSKSLYSSEKDETYTQSGKEKIKVSVNARIALLKE
ncbi:MAG: SIMPL domain-containing protein [Haemophilus parainfluenzae]|jgi:predicted secreted protein|uniref:SIMPL domain-containing protein n=1 Tax=uncultured Haemophilus sp. TaxID=237779 RepID=UPI0025F7B0F4|nr:SIMPL domain-containing protein [uncultured Haemophilus sp.]MDQ6571411.1 SIMPL domain-containing protein [Haemophilus parainfluenzae]